MFGDERAPYQEALDRFHARTPAERNTAWTHAHYISEYAAMHPLEDWAETWAHMLHIVDTLETATELGFAPALDLHADGEERRWLDAWRALSVAINELNRSMGFRDAYPFVLSDTVQQKLQFIRREMIRAARPTPRPAARETPA